MPLNAHEIAQQRHLKRHLTLWRFFAIIILLAGLIAISVISVDKKAFNYRTQHIATIEIFGIIYRDEALLDQLKKIEQSETTSGLIVIIDSPGGTVTGSEDIYLALRKIAAKKPVAALMRGLAASGGYIAAIATDQIFASGNTITGSIGVIYQWPEYVELLNKVGVKMQTVKSAPLKAEPDPSHALTEEVRQQVEIMVNDSFEWFVDLVETRRKLSHSDALRFSDGRVFSGRQAVQHNLIDAIGDIDQAKQWVENQLNIQDKPYENLELIDWTPSLIDDSGLSQFLKMQFNQLIGSPIFAPNSAKILNSNGLMAIMVH